MKQFKGNVTKKTIPTDYFAFNTLYGAEVMIIRNQERR